MKTIMRRKGRDRRPRDVCDRRSVNFDHVAILSAQRAELLKTKPRYTPGRKQALVRGIIHGAVSFAEAAAVHRISAVELIGWRRATRANTS